MLAYSEGLQPLQLVQVPEHPRLQHRYFVVTQIPKKKQTNIMEDYCEKEKNL